MRLLHLILIIILIFFIHSYAISQPDILLQNIYGGSVDDYANTVSGTSGGEFVVAGGTYSDDGDVTVNQGYSDYWIIKLNSTGNMLWQKSYGGSGTDEAISVIRTYNGGYMVAGASASQDGDIAAPHGNFDWWVIWLDSSGNITRQLSLGGSLSDQCNALIETKDTNYVMAGFAYSSDGDVTVNNGNADYWVVKIDSLGNILWEKSFGGSGEDFGAHVIQTTDDGFLVTGASASSDGDVTGNHGSYDYWIVKLDNAGSLVWQKSLGGSDQDWGNAAVQTYDGEYVITGSAMSSDGDVTGHQGDYDSWTVRLDAAGTVIWETATGGSHDDRSYSIITTEDSCFAMTGASSSSDGDVTVGYGNYDLWLQKTDTLGNLVWQKTMGGSKWDWGNAATLSGSGELIIAGYSGSNDGDITEDMGYKDWWVLMLCDFMSWTGAVDTDWNTGGNWSGGAVPVAADNPVIEAVPNQPVMNAGNDCNYCIIRPGASLVVNTGNTFNIGGNLTLGSDSTGTGYLIDYGTVNIGGTAIVQQYLTGGFSHFISTPVDDIPVTDVLWGATVREYIEPQQNWQYLDNDDTLFVMHGYDEHRDDTVTVNFTGILNTGALSLPVTNSNTGDPSVDGWNLCGNPYPSTADWRAPAGWTKLNIDNTIYYRNKTQYATYNGTTGASTNGGSRYIPAMQGFFVKCNDPAGGTLGVDNDVRTVDQQPYYKDVTNDYLNLAVSGNGSYTDETAILFVEGATEGFDADYDAYKLPGMSQAPSLFSLIASDSINVSINTLPELLNDTSVAVGFLAPASGNYTITASNLQSFDPATSVILEDIPEQQMTDLVQDPEYQFTATPADTVYRFVIHFYPTTTEINEPAGSDPINIYSTGKDEIVVASKENITGTLIITVYDLTGREVIHRSAPGNSSKVRLYLKERTGCFIVRVITDKGVYSEKVWVEGY